MIAVKIPELFNVIRAAKVKFRCTTDEKAIIFFKSVANRKKEHPTTIIIISVNVNNPEFTIEKNTSNVI
jgi:hypothetical protein